MRQTVRDLFTSTYVPRGPSADVNYGTPCICVYLPHLAVVKVRSRFIVTDNPGLHHLVDPARPCAKSRLPVPGYRKTIRRIKYRPTVRQTQFDRRLIFYQLLEQPRRHLVYRGRVVTCYASADQIKNSPLCWMSEFVLFPKERERGGGKVNRRIISTARTKHFSRSVINIQFDSSKMKMWLLALNIFWDPSGIYRDFLSDFVRSKCFQNVLFFGFVSILLC